MSVLLKKQVKTKLDDRLKEKCGKRVKAMIQDKGHYKTLSSKGIGDSDTGE